MCGPFSSAHTADAAAQRPVGSDTLVFDGTLRSEQALPGDVIAAAGTLDVQASVAGHALLGGGTLRLGGTVGPSLFAAAGHLNVDAALARNLRVGGGQVDLSPATSQGGNLSVGGGQASLRGPSRALAPPFRRADPGPPLGNPGDCTEANAWH